MTGTDVRFVPSVLAEILELTGVKLRLALLLALLGDPLRAALVPLHSGFDPLNLNLSWPELWDRLGPFWRGPFWL